MFVVRSGVGRGVWMSTIVRDVQMLLCDLRCAPALSRAALVDRLEALPRPSRPLEHVIADGFLLNVLLAARAPHDRWISQWLHGKRRQAPDRVTMALEFIEAHFSAPLKSVDIADRVGCHDTTLRRQFRRRVGISMKELQVRIRIARAVAMLRDGAPKVSAVARAVGYECEKNFYCEFKRRTGVTPASARRHPHSLIGRVMRGLGDDIRIAGADQIECLKTEP